LWWGILTVRERELEVLGLVAVGRTNREIDEQLFVSVKTASTHVSNIISKLNVSSRVQAGPGRNPSVSGSGETPGVTVTGGT
jgi:DNA-binding CsgD family transcriptional regulator